MGADERAHPDADGKAGRNSGEQDEWFKEAAARWELRKAEEKARAEETGPAEEKLPTEDNAPAEKNAPAEASPTGLPSEAAGPPEPRARRETDELQSDLRDMAAAALAPPARADSVAGLKFVAPPVDDAVEVPRPRRRWMTAAVVGGALVVLGATAALVMRPRAVPQPVQKEAAAVAPTPVRPPESQPAAAPPAKPAPAAAEPAPKAEPKAEPKQVARKTTTHHATKSRTSVKRAKKKTRPRH